MHVISWLSGKPKPWLILSRGEELVRKDKQQNLARKEVIWQELVWQELVRQDQQQNLLSQCRPYILLPSGGRGQGKDCGSGMMR